MPTPSAVLTPTMFWRTSSERGCGGHNEGDWRTMSDVTVAELAAVEAAEAAEIADERLAYRSVIQRLFIRPEIGAIIGAVAIWVFFWAVASQFGTVGGTSTVLDIAATLGIMAVAVSMLMIGGEFDLSSGAMTGAMGILTILLVKDVGEMGGAGLSLWIAIPISFVVAMGVGFFNGTMVEKTRLPSFIVTLGTFFVLRGAKLGFSKLIVDQVQVGRIDEGEGYEFWYDVFAAEWPRNDHQFDGRDVVYLLGTLIGVALIVARRPRDAVPTAGRDEAGRARRVPRRARHRDHRCGHTAHHRRDRRQLARRGADRCRRAVRPLRTGDMAVRAPLHVGRVDLHARHPQTARDRRRTPRVVDHLGIGLRCRLE